MARSSLDESAIDAVRQSWPGAFRDGSSDGDLRADAVRAADELMAGRSATIDTMFAAMDSVPPRLAWMPGEADLIRSPLLFLSRYWHARVDGGKLPLSAEIDAVDLVPALGYVMLLEPVDDATDFRYRVYGSRIVEYSKVEMTGKRVWDIPAPLVAAYFVATYRSVVFQRQALFAAHKARLDGYFADWERLILPFVDASGEVDRLLVGNVPILRV